MLTLLRILKECLRVSADKGTQEMVSQTAQVCVNGVNMQLLPYLYRYIHDKLMSKLIMLKALMDMSLCRYWWVLQEYRWLQWLCHMYKHGGKFWMLLQTRIYWRWKKLYRYTDSTFHLYARTHNSFVSYMNPGRQIEKYPLSWCRNIIAAVTSAQNYPLC